MCLLMFVSISGIAQNSNFRAQGNYYSAKSNFENKDYSKALTYVNKCKTELGGTNYQLQYLHILIAYNLYQYDEAADELQLYFDMADKKIEAVRFDKSVDELTDDETKALTMLIDPILESAAKRKNNPCSLCKGSGFTTPCDYCESRGYLKTDCIHNSEGYRCDNGKAPCWADAHIVNSGNINSPRKYCSICRNSDKIDCDKCSGLGYSKNSCTHCSGNGYNSSTSTSSKRVKCTKCQGVGF